MDCKTRAERDKFTSSASAHFHDRLPSRLLAIFRFPFIGTFVGMKIIIAPSSFAQLYSPRETGKSIDRFAANFHRKTGDGIASNFSLTRAHARTQLADKKLPPTANGVDAFDTMAQCNQATISWRHETRMTERARLLLIETGSCGGPRMLSALLHFNHASRSVNPTLRAADADHVLWPRTCRGRTGYLRIEPRRLLLQRCHVFFYDFARSWVPKWGRQPIALVSTIVKHSSD